MLRSILIAFLLGLAGYGPAYGQSRAPVETLTLDSAVASALRDNPMLRKASLEIDKFADREAAAATRRLPLFEVELQETQPLTPLDFRFSKGIFGDYLLTGPIPSEDTKISTPRQPTTYLVARVSQPLTQLHRLGLGVKLEELRGKVARERLRAEQRAVERDVKSAYYEVARLQGAVQSVEENIKLYRELDRVVGQYVAEKAALKSEGLDVKTRLAAEELGALKLRNALASQKEQLNALLGRDVTLEFAVSPSAENIAFEMDLASARARALEKRPELKASRLQLEGAEIDRRLKHSELIPDVSLALTYQRIAPISIIPQNIATVGLVMKWEPFDWGRRKRERAEKIKTAEQARLEINAAEARVILEVNSIHRKLTEARAQLQVARFAQEAAREKLRVAANRYGEQAALFKDVLQAQSGVAEMSDVYQQALLAFWKARADFGRAIDEE